MKKIIVLGGTGFHGSHVVRLAKNKGYTVKSISRREGVDIRNLTQLKATFAEFKPDAIIDCAGHEGSVHYVNQHAAEVAHDTFQMALNIYRATADICPKAIIVNALGNCSYPGNVTIAKESEWLDGPVHESVLASGMEKRVKYIIAASYYNQYGIKSINWIMSNCYGPGAGTDPNKLHALNGIILRMIQAQKNREAKFTIWGTGTPIREWIYVEDAAKMLLDSICLPQQIYPVNFAQNKGYSIKEIAEITAKKLNYPVKFEFDTTKADGAPIKILDNTIFHSKYPDYLFTPIDKGICETITYYKSILK